MNGNGAGSPAGGGEASDVRVAIEMTPTPAPARAAGVADTSGLLAYFQQEEEARKREWENTPAPVKALILAQRQAEALPGQIAEKVNALPGMNTVKAGLDKTKEGLLTGACVRAL